MKVAPTQLPYSNLDWTDTVRGKEYLSILNILEKRPIVAWFDHRRKRGIRLLVRLSNTFYEKDLSRNEWGIVSDDGRHSSSSKVLTLQEALTSLPLGAEWKMCEFQTQIEYHQAVLEYLQ